jgi:hypothetical protein
MKVDQGLLRELAVNPIRTFSLIGGILEMARETAKAVVIEGLESTALVEAALMLGSRYGQGFALGNPMKTEDIVRWYRGFELPYRSDAVTTALGALAYHWRSARSDYRHLECDLEHCPVTAFLESVAEGASDARVWHQKLHKRRTTSSTWSSLLANWLQEQVRSEAEAKRLRDRQSGLLPDAAK